MDTQEKTRAPVRAEGSVREQLIQLVRDAGYDLFTACEEADRVIKEAREGGVRRTYYVRATGEAITLEPRGGSDVPLRKA